MKKLLFSVFWLTLTVGVWGQKPLQLATIGDLPTTSGQVIPNCQVGYRTFGKLNEARNNAILFPTYFSGKSQDIMGHAGNMIDTTKYFLILVDALGNGVSSSPSNTPNFPEISIRDMVNSQKILCEKILNIKHLHTVIGVSMGGMQTFEWLVAYPQWMDRVVPIVGTPRQSFYDQLLWRTEWNIIEQAGASPEARKNAMKQVAAVHHLNLYTPAYWNRSQAPEKVGEFMEKSGMGYQNAQHPDNWICQIRAMLGHDIYRSSGKKLAELAKENRTEGLVVVATQDFMVNPKAAQELAQEFQWPLVSLTGDCGHVATACEFMKIKEAIITFLN
jgi:homoserine O-acetyltransferase/O-succinyltransferase